MKIEELRTRVENEKARAAGNLTSGSLQANVLNRLGVIAEDRGITQRVDTTDYTMLPAFSGRDQYVERLQNENNARIDNLAGALGDHTLSREQFDKYPDFAGRYNDYNDYVLNRYQQAADAYNEHLSTAPVTKNQMVNGYRPNVYRDATTGRVPQNNETLAAAAQQQGRNEMDELLRERWLTAAAVYPKNSPQYEYQQTHLKKIDEQLGAINDKYKIDTTPYSFGKGLAGAVREGISTASTGIGNTLAFAEDIALAPLEWLTGSAPGTLSDNAPFNQLAEQLRLEDEQIRNYYAENVRKGGTAGRAFDAVLSGTVAAAPQAVFALMTGGASTMTTAGLQATSTAALSPSLSGTVMRTIVNTAKDPNFWLAFAQEAGSDYEQALADGASRNAATLYALGAGIMNAYVEVGGGIQTLPQELAGSKAAWRAFVESAVDEGKEEIAQGIIERASQNLFYGKGNKLFSTTDENAVINPVTSAKEGAMGAAIGAILGAGQTAATKVSNKIKANAAAKIQAEKNALPNMLGEAFVNAVANNDFSGFNALGVSNNVAQRIVNEYKAKGGITSSIVGTLMAEVESKAQADIQNSPYQIATPEYNDATGTTGFEVPYTQQTNAEPVQQLGNEQSGFNAPPVQEDVTPEQRAEIERVMDEVFGDRVDENQATGYTESVNPMNTEEAINGQGTDDQSQLGRSSLRGRPADEGVGLGERERSGQLYEQDGADAQRARAWRYGAEEADGRAVGWLPDEEVNQYPELKSLRDRYAEDGISVGFVKGYIPGGVRTDRNGNKYEVKSAGRATRKGKILVSVTHQIAPQKIGGHEYNHEMLARHGDDLFLLQGQALKSMLTEDERLDIADLYFSSWKSLNNYRAVMEEILCDTYAGIIRSGSPITEEMCNRICEITDRYLAEQRGGSQIPTDEQLGAQALEMLGESTPEGAHESPWDEGTESADDIASKAEARISELQDEKNTDITPQQDADFRRSIELANADVNISHLQSKILHSMFEEIDVRRFGKPDPRSNGGHYDYAWDDAVRAYDSLYKALERKAEREGTRSPFEGDFGSYRAMLADAYAGIIRPDSPLTEEMCNRVREATDRYLAEHGEYVEERLRKHREWKQEQEREWANARNESNEASSQSREKPAKQQKIPASEQRQDLNSLLDDMSRNREEQDWMGWVNSFENEAPPEANTNAPVSDEEMDEVRREAAAEQRKKNIERKRTKGRDEWADVDNLLDRVRREDADRNQAEQEEFEEKKSREFFGDIYRNVPDESSLEELQREQQEVVDALSNPDLADSVKNTLRQRFNDIQRDIAAITRRQNGLPFAGNDVSGMTQTQLQAEKVQLEDELKNAKNATTRAAIQNRLDEVNEQLNANHTADMPGPTPELEAPPPPKRGRDVPSTSSAFGDKTGVTHVSETEQERWKDDDELVTYLDGTFKTAREAFEFLRELNETADANLKSSINRVAAGPLIDRAAAEKDFETVKNLENTYVAGMSEHGTVLSQSMPTTPAARARAIAANMFNRITDQRRLRIDTSGDNKGIHVREMNEQERAEYQKVMEKTKDWTYKAGGIIHAYQMGGHEEDAHLEMYHLLKEICKERGYKMSARDGNTLSSLSTNEIYDTCMAAAIGYMFDKAPRTASQYVRDFQLIAQLLNPTTILKNITTNAVVGPLENLTTLPATIVDAILSPIAKLQSKSDVSASNMRTIAPTGRLYQLKNIKAGLNEAKVSIARADINAPSGAKGKYDERVYQLENSSRHATAVGNLLGGAQGVMERLLQIALGTTDSIMSTITEQNVEDSLRKFVGNKNNRIDSETAKLLASRAGAKAYFHSTTEIGEALASLNVALNLLGIGNSGTRTAKILGKEFTVHDFGLGDVFANYARTAGNIAQFGLEYTPLGVIKAMHNLFIMSEANRLVAEGKGNQRYFTRLGSERLGFENLTNQQRAVVAQREAAMSIARPIVGTMLVSALRWLAQMGILMFTDPREENDDKKASDQAKGLSGVQLNLSAIGRVLNGQYDPGQQDDDDVINLTDFPPFDTLAEVAGVWNELDNENPDADTYLKILSGTMLAAGTVLGNQSMMKTYETISNGIAYRDRKDAEGNELTPIEQAKSAAFDIGTGLAADSITGFVPGWIRRLASATDDYKRDVYADSAAETVWNKIKNAIPGLRQTLPEKLDSFGNPVENDMNGVINTLLNPYPVRNLNISEIDSFVDSIGVYPERKAPSYFTYDTDGDGKSERYNMSADERRKWHETYTNAYNDVVQQLMDSAHLDELSKDEQKKILSNIKSYSLATAKNEYLDSLGLSYDMTSNTSAQSIAKALGAITQAQEKGSDLDLAQYYIAKREHDRIDDAGGDKVKEFDRWLSSQSWIDETERQILRNTQTFTNIRTEGRIAEDGKKSDSVFENLESFGIGRDASYTIDDALAAAKKALPEGEELKDWQKYEAIAGANVSDADKLKAILYYERAERANGPTMRERTQQAYDEGFSIDDIVAYKKLCSDYSKLGDRAMHFDEYGLDNRTYFRLKYIYSQ